MDRLALDEITEFAIPTHIMGDICDDELLIELLPDQISYQWYYEGVALVGQTDRVLKLDTGSQEGTYVAVIDTPDGCFFSNEFLLAFPPTEYDLSLSICEGEALEFGPRFLTETGSYSELFLKGTVCDSIVHLDLTVHPHTEGTQDLILCEGESVTHEGQTWETPGTHELAVSYTHLTLPTKA